MGELNFKQMIIVVIVGIIIIATIGFYFYKVLNKDNKEEYFEEYNELKTSEKDLNENQDQNVSQIIIHITGCVINPGVITLENGSRISDAIEKAGGETTEADLDKINLAYILQDGEKLYIPSKNENINEIDSYISTESGKNVIEKGNEKTGNKNEIININSATKDELKKLSGIGESTADKIIEYRKENGKFNTIEDIKNVPGIGDAKFNNIKDKIKVK